MQVNLRILILVLSTVVSCTAKFEWNELSLTLNVGTHKRTYDVRWAEECGFSGNRNVTRKISRDDCIQKCVEWEACQSFTWKDVDDGTCQHSPAVSHVELRGSAQRHVCGYKPNHANAICEKYGNGTGKPEANIDWENRDNGMVWSKNCKYGTYDNIIHDTSLDECVDHCSTTSSCYTFVWQWESGLFFWRGACMMRRGVEDPIGDSYGFRCGYSQYLTSHVCDTFAELNIKGTAPTTSESMSSSTGMIVYVFIYESWPLVVVSAIVFGVIVVLIVCVHRRVSRRRNTNSDGKINMNLLRNQT